MRDFIKLFTDKRFNTLCLGVYEVLSENNFMCVAYIIFSEKEYSVLLKILMY